MVLVPPVCSPQLLITSTYTARQTTILQASISRLPVSANIRQAPLLLHTTEPQVFNYSRLISHMWQSNSFMNQGHWQSKLDPPGPHATVSLSLPKSPSFPVTLQALVAKVTTTISLSLSWLSRLSLLPKSPNFSHNQKCRSHMQRNCNTLSHAAQSLSPIFPRLPLLSGTPSPISTTYLIQHWGHRYFNLPVPCGICLRYAHASHKPASASRLPNPWDGLWASL